MYSQLLKPFRSGHVAAQLMQQAARVLQSRCNLGCIEDQQGSIQRPYWELP